MTDTACECAMWRVCYRLDKKGPQAAHQLQSNLNVERKVMSDAIRTLDRTQIIEMDGSKWELRDSDYGTIMKVNDRVER